MAVFFRMKALGLSLLSVLSFSYCNVNHNTLDQSSWTSGTNLTEVLNKKGAIELSGLHWNPTKNQLFAIQDDGLLHIIQLNKNSNSFEQIGNLSSLGSPEGITQVEFNDNEFYTIDETSYEIRKYSYSSDFTSAQLEKKWNLLIGPSFMPNTGNDGAEGIAFVPDKYLKNIGFISSETDEPYVSKKGMNGLIFIAHQKKGMIWVYDINPLKDDDFIFVGKYKTNSNESCDLEFDRSTGLMYILHNDQENTLEVTDLTSELALGKRKLTTIKEYQIPSSDDNNNIEGFAITPKFADSTHVSVWLCRDINKRENKAVKKDAIRWFKSFNAIGTQFQDWK